MKIGKKILLPVVLVVWFAENISAQITAGKIIYERKTNMVKRFKDNDYMKEWMKEEGGVRVDVFELYFTDSFSVFKPQESDLKERFSWATSKNSVYQDFANNKRMSIKDIWGEKVLVEDSLWNRKWKITESKRNIGGFNCRKAIWQANDSTRIYAWYCDEITVSTGPESFVGLPGAIMGLATEDGGIVYFARRVEILTPDKNILLLPKSKSKIYPTAELKAKMEKDYGKETWGKQMINQFFGLW